MNSPPTGLAVEGLGKPEKHLSFSCTPSLSPHATAFPPGLVGEIAQFILDAAPRPVREIALAGAVGLMAGITGRAYNVSGTGLNQYMLVIARTGLGKEAIASGISKLIKAVYSVTSNGGVPAAFDFIGPTEIASPQALIKWLTRTPCMYSIVGEFGLKLKEMSAPHAPAHIAGLKRALLDLYHKSGRGSVLGAMAYSKREDNTAVVKSPAFTLIGESTPEKFYENVNDDIITDGLLPRFSIIEYAGERQKLNKAHADAVPGAKLTGDLAALAAHCLALGSTGKVHDVLADLDAEAVFDRFNDWCDGQINDQTENAVGRELWNRAHLKAMKLAALYAVGINYINPQVTGTMAQHACNEVHAQTVSLKRRFSNGDVGAVPGNEAKQLREIEKVFAKYATEPFAQFEKYGATEALHRDRVILASHIKRRLGDTAAFRVPGGATKAIDQCLKRMLEADEIKEIRKDQMLAKYGTAPRAFAISNPKFILEAL